MTTEAAHERGQVDSYVERLDGSERLFIADPAKHRVVSALMAYLTKNKPESFLAIAPDPVTAAELAVCFERCFGKISVVDSVQRLDKIFEFASLAGINGLENKSREKVARILKKSHPNLIVSLEDNTGMPFLNKEFFQDLSLNGSLRKYPDGNLGYAFADLLADAEYDFVYMDEIYRLFAFKKCADNGELSVDLIDPLEYDVMYFNDYAYYTPRSKSYKRLDKIADSAGRLLVYTDCLTAGAGVNLYAAKKLTDNLKLFKLRGKIGEYITEQNAEVLHYTLNNALENEGVTDYVMSLGKSCFSDVDVLAKRISDMFKFMTQQELFLRFSRVYIKICGAILSDDFWFDNMLDFITEDDRNFARCVYDLLLADETEVRVAKSVSAEDIAELIESFGGIVYRLTSTDFDVVRVRRLESSFDYILEKRHGRIRKRDNESVLTSVGQNNCGYNKYFAAFRTVCAEKGPKKPFIIVVSRDSVEKAKTLVKNISEKFGYTYLKEAKELYGDSMSDNAVVAVIDIPHFAATPCDFCARIIYFADIHPADRFFAGLMDKAKGMRLAPRIILSSTRDDFSGILVERYFKKSSDLSKVNDKSENMIGNYTARVKKIEAVYMAMRQLADGAIFVGDSAEVFRRELADINTQNVFFAPDSDFRLAQMKQIGKFFSEVISNSVTIEEGGDSIIFVDPPPVEKPTFRKETLVGTQSSSNRYVFFGTCIKYLRGMCPPPANCADCPNYEKLAINNSKQFFKGITDFFDAVKVYAAGYRELFENQVAGRSIHSASSDADFEKNMSETDQTIFESERTAKALALSLKRGNTGTEKAMFHVDYDIIEGIRSALYKAYIKAFGDFFDLTENMMATEDVGLVNI